MEREELSRFLSLVRRRSLLDYLDPMGEPPASTLERRLRWARIHQDDPDRAEEARFLLRHRERLAEILADEVETAVAFPDLSTPAPPSMRRWGAQVIDEDDDPTDHPEAVTEEIARPGPFNPDLLASNLTRLEDLTPVRTERIQQAEVDADIPPVFAPPIPVPRPTLPRREENALAPPWVSWVAAAILLALVIGLLAWHLSG